MTLHHGTALQSMGRGGGGGRRESLCGPHLGDGLSRSHVGAITAPIDTHIHCSLFV